MKVKPASFNNYELGHDLTSKEFVEIFIKKFYSHYNGIDIYDTLIFGVEFYIQLFKDILERWPEKKRHKISGKSNFKHYLCFIKKHISQNDDCVIEEAIKYFLCDREHKYTHIMQGITNILFGEQFYFCDYCTGLEGNYCMMQFILYYYFVER